jgi:protocatechuate 3,4-dioxygenase beta subunit
MTHVPEREARTDPSSTLGRRELLGIGALGAAALAGARLPATAPPLSPADPFVPAPPSPPLHLPGFVPADDDDDVTPPCPEDLGLRNPFAHLRGSRPVSEAELRAARTFLLQSTFCRRSSTNVEGPYYVQNPLVRQHIVEDRQGLPVTMFFLVVREADCSPIPGATVDVWHSDAAGVYSGFANQGSAGRVFLRGVQTTDQNGIARFETVFPGWYTGRTAHVHVKVRPTPTTVITSQTYFDQLFGFSGSLSDAIYRFLPPYRARGPANTTNQADRLFTADTVMAAILNPDGSPSLWTGIRFAVA